MSRISFLDRSCRQGGHFVTPSSPSKVATAAFLCLVFLVSLHSTVSAETQRLAPLTAEGALWKVWDWQPLDQGLHCKWAALRPPTTVGLPPPLRGSICLRSEDDLLSNEILKLAYWRECADLPELLGRTSTDDLVLDIGSNIGSCLLHLLLTTDARVLAFEPGLANRFYANPIPIAHISLIELTIDM